MMADWLINLLRFVLYLFIWQQGKIRLFTESDTLHIRLNYPYFVSLKYLSIVTIDKQELIFY